MGTTIANAIAYTLFGLTLVLPFRGEIAGFFRDESVQEVINIATSTPVIEQKVVERIIERPVVVEKIVEVPFIVEVPKVIEAPIEIQMQPEPVIEPVKALPRPDSFEVFSPLLTIGGGNCGMAGAYVAVKDQYGSYMDNILISSINDAGDLFAVASTTLTNGKGIPTAWVWYKTPDTNTTHSFTIATGEYPTVAQTFEVKVGESFYEQMLSGKLKYRFEHPKITNIWVGEDGRSVDAETGLCL